jgi:Cu2+-exporting ATPase
MAEALTIADAGVLPSRAAAPAVTIRFAVENMTCGHCIRRVEETLLAAGAASARANLSERRVTVTSSAAADIEQMLGALAAKGFKASILKDTDATATGHDSDLLRRLGVAGFAAANIMLLSVSVWAGHAHDMPASLQTGFHWLSALIGIPAIIYAGQPFFASARQALSAGRLNMDVPISLGVTLATAMSLYQTVRGSEQVYFDAAIGLIFFLLIGRVLDAQLRSRARSAAENLLGLTATHVDVKLPNGTVSRCPIADVRPGVCVRIAAGERIPVDAKLVAGEASIDESLVTGETVPRLVLAGDALYSGTINLSGPIEAIATAAADRSLLAEIARLMHAAEQSRGRYVRLADRAARLYAPAVHILGAVTFAGWMFAGMGWEPALTAAIAVLIITCPCALALAVPAVQVVAVSQLFKRGILVKAADGLERLAEIDTVVFDKTGTLTLGVPRLDPGTLSDATLTRAASLAASSRHPYSLAIVHAARQRGLEVRPRDDVREVAGAGLEARQGAELLRLGSAEFCDAQGLGRTTSVWFRDGDHVTALPMHDALRTDAAETIARLRGRGYALEILSGDRADAVGPCAAQLAITHWRAAAKPTDKIAHVESLAARGAKVLMVGDGLNDAPALAAGHASMSPSTATDISQTAADGVFQGERLAPIMATLIMAKAARRHALQNFAIAIGYNVVFVPLAMAGMVTPLIAAIAMSASSLAVTANALRLAHVTRESKT